MPNYPAFDFDQVERLLSVSGHRPQGVCCRPLDDADASRDVGASEVRAGQCGVGRVGLERGDVTLGSHSASEPDGAVPGEGPDLQHPACPGHLDQERQQLALVRGDLVGGEPGMPRGLPSGDELSVLLHELVHDVVVDG